MSDQGNVSTEETPKREPMNVVTSENESASQVDPQPDPAAPPKGASNEGDSADPTDPPKDPPKSRRSRRAERRIAALQKQVDEAKSEGEAAKAEVAELRKEIDQLKAGPPAEPLKKPKLGDFKTAEEFGAAWAKWEAQEAAAAEPPPPKKEDPPKKAEAPPAAEPPPEAEVLAEKGAKLYGDEFEEVLFSDDLILSENMADYAFESEKGPELIMWLDEHPEDAKELFRMRPTKLRKELDEIVAELQTPEAPAGDKTPARDPDTGKFVSKQDPPPPIDPIRGNPDSTINSGEIKEGLDMDTYAERRRAQMKAHRVR